jgi:hypothetical protein
MVEVGWLWGWKWDRILEDGEGIGSETGLEVKARQEI